MSNYKQVTGISIEIISSDAHTNETLKAHYQSNDLQTIYFGLKDDNGNYEGKLTESSYELTSTISGCSATISIIDSTKTAGIITYTVSANTGKSQRSIPFNYNNTTLFTITQDAAKNKVKKGTIYIIAFSAKTDYGYELYIFNSNQGDSFTSSINYTPFPFSVIQNGKVVLYYSNENIIINNKKVRELFDNGTLVYKDGKNNLSELMNTNAVYNPTLYTDTKAPTRINVYNSTATVPLTFTTKLYVYQKELNTTNKYHQLFPSDIAFYDITNNKHWGAYDYYVYQ